MKQLFLTLFIFAAQLNDIDAQNQRCYTYDTAGNRTQRACNFFRIVDTDPQKTVNLNPENVESRSIVDAQNLDAAIVPNPASGEIEISAKGFGSDAKWNIITQDGKVAMTGALIFGQKVDISHLAEGIYYMRIQEGEDFKVLVMDKKCITL
ncbi:MAG: T9SS type A sorting domain-containing protein [Saprospiraceae bacterium]|nr:T9SS type A sorting domain-containing protein [Saprospiraceae bacterium]